MVNYDVFWSFRSPCSYLLTKQLVALERDFDVQCNVRVVYPITVRTPEFFDKNDPLWLQYLKYLIREHPFNAQQKPNPASSAG